MCAISWGMPAYSIDHDGSASKDDGTVKKLKVLASIPPLALIAQEILGEYADVEVLIAGAASPHDYALTIGQALSLQDADVLLWVGPEFEQFLVDVTFPPVNLSIAAAISSEGEHQETKGHAHHSEHAERHHHDHGDSHLWLNDHYVEVYASAIAEKAALLRPKAADNIQQSLAGFISNYKKAIEENEALLNNAIGSSKRSFIAHHDGYTQLLPRYHLEQNAALTRVPHERISAKRLASIEKSLSGVSCLLAEADEAQEAKRYARILGLPLVEMDILASKQVFGSYADFERSLGRALEQCFKQ